MLEWLIEKLKARTEAEEREKAEATTSSQTNAKPDVNRRKGIWFESREELPAIGSNVEISDDGITVRETADYIESRTCMLAGVGGGNGYFGLGFATDGSTGCDKGLILDTPAYWRF